MRFVRICLRLLVIVMWVSPARDSFAQADTDAQAFVTIAPFSMSTDSARNAPGDGAGLQIG